MKAMAIQGDYGIDNLKPLERDVPAPGPGEVLVRMKAASLNYRDLATVSGMYGGGFPLPLVPLSDGAGDIVAVADDVTWLKEGDKVASLFFQGWSGGEPTLEKLSTALGGPIDGCAQEEIAFPASGVIKVPDSLSHAEAACLPCAALTAWRALIVEGGLKAGETVLLQGTGGVSIFALQFAKAAGAEVIITSSSDEKLNRAKELGADHFINYKKTPEWAKEARTLTGGRGVDHVVEVGGAETFPQSLQAARIGGHVSVIGVLSGVVKDLAVPAIFSSNLKVKGITVGSAEQFEAMNRAIGLHGIRPVIDRHFDLEAAPDALKHMQSGSHFGKIVLDIGG